MVYLLLRRFIKFLFETIKKKFQWIPFLILVLLALNLDEALYVFLYTFKPFIHMSIFEIPVFFSLTPGNMFLFCAYYILKCFVSFFHSLVYLFFFVYQIPQFIIIAYDLLVALFVFGFSTMYDNLTSNLYTLIFEIIIFNILIFLKHMLFFLIALPSFWLSIWLDAWYHILLSLGFDANLIFSESFINFFAYVSSDFDSSDDMFSCFHKYEAKIYPFLEIYLKFCIDKTYIAILFILDDLLFKDNSFFFFLFNNVNFPLIDIIIDCITLFKYTFWFVYASLEYFFFFFIFPFLSLIFESLEILDSDGDDLDPFPDMGFTFSEYLIGYKDQYYPGSHIDLAIFCEKMQGNPFNFIKYVALMYFDFFAAAFKIITPTDVNELENLMNMIAFNQQYNNYVNHLLVFDQVSFLDFIEMKHRALAVSSTIDVDTFPNAFMLVFPVNRNLVGLFSHLVILSLILSVYYWYTWMDFQIIERTNDSGILNIFIDIKNYIKKIFCKYFFFILLFVLSFCLILFFFGIVMLYIIRYLL